MRVVCGRAMCIDGRTDVGKDGAAASYRGHIWNELGVRRFSRAPFLPVFRISIVLLYCIYFRTLPSPFHSHPVRFATNKHSTMILLLLLSFTTAATNAQSRTAPVRVEFLRSYLHISLKSSPELPTQKRWPVLKTIIGNTFIITF
jgi:hypothetical protein